MQLLYIHWNIDPEIINLFGISLRYYGVLFVGGLVLSLSVLGQMFRQEHIAQQHLDTLSIYGMVGIFLGARSAHCFFYEGTYYLSHPLEILLPIRHIPGAGYEFTGYQGLASHGGVVGIMVALWLYTRRTKEPLGRTLGMIAIVAPIAGAFIRFANLMNSEIIGKPTELPWAFVFEQVDSIPRHPAQLYEALGYLLVFACTYWLYKQKRFTISPYFYLGFSLSCVFLIRFLIEFLKEAQVPFEESWQLNMGQWLSLPFFVLGIGLMAMHWKKTPIQETSYYEQNSVESID